MGDVALQDISQQILEGCSKGSRKQQSCTECLVHPAIRSLWSHPCLVADCLYNTVS